MIITDEKLLRVDCADVSLAEVLSLRERLENELLLSAEQGRPGIGLAAPQIGIAKKMAIVRIPTKDGRMISFDLVNCHIAAAFDLAPFEGEGCLSFPGIIERTFRYQEIYVVNNLVEPHSFILLGLPAVAAQHELDHLNKVLFIDSILKQGNHGIR